MSSSSRLRSRAGLGCALLLAAMAPVSAAMATGTLMPVPAEMQFAPEGRLAITATFKLSVHGHDDARLRAALVRTLDSVEARTGLAFAHVPAGDYAWATDPATASLAVECAGPGSTVPTLGEDESYTLTITPTQAVLRAPTVVGAMRGCATLLQLLQSDARGWFLPAVTIKDHPRFPWRGLMIDVCRHWQPMDVIKRNLDGMALVKLNVLHLHLTDDQGFRIESKTFPRLHELGSDGHYFTQAEMREIIAYAAARGIRVVPEFDMPGHATSWVVGYPELASAPGPYVTERKWGVFDPVLDPTNPKVYELLEGFLGEMAALFPDEYLHIGGDENNGVQWSANARIQAFIRDHHLKDNAGLHAWFNQHVHGILARHGKKLVGWDEILHPDLPAGSIVQSWRGPAGIADATQRGFATILSHGYYIDLMYPASDHYLNDPAPVDAPLTPAQRRLVLGGEATMWAEWVTPETIDSRIWPRTAAIAERLWSAATVRDVPDMYRRLAIVSRRLEEAGLHHESYLPPALRRLAGDSASDHDLEALRRLVDLLEPVKHYQRGQQQPDFNQLTPLTGLVDCARPDSAAAREFAAAVDAMVFGSSPNARVLLADDFAGWHKLATSFDAGLLKNSPRLFEAAPLVRALDDAAGVGEEALRVLDSGHPSTAEWMQTQLAALDRAATPRAALEQPALAAVRWLVVAAAEQGKRATLSPEAWRQQVESLARPAKNSSP